MLFFKQKTVARATDTADVRYESTRQPSESEFKSVTNHHCPSEISVVSNLPPEVLNLGFLTTSDWDGPAVELPSASMSSAGLRGLSAEEAHGMKNLLDSESSSGSLQIALPSGSGWIEAPPGLCKASSTHHPAAKIAPCFDLKEDAPSDFANDDDDDITIIVGPTEHAAIPCQLQDLKVPGCLQKLRSRPDSVLFSEVYSLMVLRYPEAPCSFGSLVHMNFQRRQVCRPCMFERVPGRCRRSIICDFCHLHHSRKADNDAVTPQQSSSGAGTTIRSRHPRVLQKEGRASFGLTSRSTCSSQSSGSRSAIRPSANQHQMALTPLPVGLKSQAQNRA